MQITNSTFYTPYFLRVLPLIILHRTAFESLMPFVPKTCVISICGFPMSQPMNTFCTADVPWPCLSLTSFRFSNRSSLSRFHWGRRGIVIMTVVVSRCYQRCQQKSCAGCSLCRLVPILPVRGRLPPPCLETPVQKVEVLEHVGPTAVLIC